VPILSGFVGVEGIKTFLKYLRKRLDKLLVNYYNTIRKLKQSGQL